MDTLKEKYRMAALAIASVALAAALPLGAAWAHHPEALTDDPSESAALPHLHLPGDKHAAMAAHDSATADIITDGPFADVVKNLADAGHGARPHPNATTDVWALDGHAYTGTFNSPCGGAPDAGIWVWKTNNANDPQFVTVIPSPTGARSNDVKVANMNSGRILVHSNERCAAGGPGGFEVYNVDDPANPVHLAHVQVDEINQITPIFFAAGALIDNGVHNLFLFTQGARDYVAVQSEGIFDGFRIYEITDPANPVLVSGWGAEEVFDPGVGDLADRFDPSQVGRALNATLWMLGLSPFTGFGASPNRLLHDFTISADGTRAYLAHWDAGLILLDISDPAAPSLISVALEPTSEDGEVNSHSVWPSEDGTVVVEGEEDFAPFRTTFRITSGPAAGEVPAAEGGFTTPIATLPGSQMSGQTIYVGAACTPLPDGSSAGFDDPVPTAAPGQIALIQRGFCRFDEKASNAIAAGYTGMVVFSDAARAGEFFPMGGNPRDIAGVMVAHATGLAIAGVSSAADLVIGNLGETVAATVEPDGWSGLRVWDYSDPANPVLATTINTVCSANPVDASCDPRGTYSSHNVIVENEGGRVKAYVSWYADGVLAFDVTDPYMPLETARYHRAGAEFEAENGGIQNVWGIYKEPRSPWIYASDRNGGLYILKEFGWGSAKVAKN